MDVPLHDSLEGQVAVVTGANRGIGAEVARQLVGHGATVYAGARRPDAEVPQGTTRVPLDVTDDDAVAAAAEVVREAEGRLDILVNNAGIAEDFRQDLREMSLAVFDKTVATNLRGTVAVTRAMLPLLLQNKGSRVVNVSSGVANLDGMNGKAPAYRVSKVGVNGLTTYLHGEYNDEHALVANCVCPGWVRTDLGGKRADRTVEEGADTPVWLARFDRGAPSGRFWRDREPIPW